MHHQFAQLLERHTPPINRDVMDGLACKYMQQTEAYVDEVFRSASASFPTGLEYIGYERCTPEEEYLETTKSRNNKRMFDIARSDLYSVKYKFTYLNEPLPPRYISLPYVLDGGVMTLGGAKFHVTPVISDKVISPGSDSVFVRLLRYKIIFKRCYHSMVYDGHRETTHVIWSQIYRKAADNKKVPDTTRAQTSLCHYLFAKYGFTRTFEHYAGVIPIVGYDEINTNTYPPDQWVICESSQIKPKTFIGDYYRPNTMRLAIPRSHWNTTVKGLVVGFYYVIDHFPDRFKPEYLDHTQLWMILLGHIVFSGVFGENKLYSQISEHFISLDDYIDTIVSKKLAECGYRVESFYDLLILVITEFNTLVLDSNATSNSMFGKSLEVLYYMLYDISSSIFKVNFRLVKLATKKTLSRDDIIETFNREMRPGAIYGLASGKIITESVSYSGDHKYPKITSKITEQESLPGAMRGKSKRLSIGTDKHLDASMIEAGSMLFLSKSNPSPTNRISPYVKIDLSTGTILQNPQFVEMLARTQRLLKGISQSTLVIDLAGDLDDTAIPD
jgi:hypothetical protein